MGAKIYVRLRFLQANGRARTVWAVKLGENRYLVADKYGETETDMGTTKEGLSIERKELLLTSPGDIVFERPARMNLKYAELEEDGPV